MNRMAAWLITLSLARFLPTCQYSVMICARKWGSKPVGPGWSEGQHKCGVKQRWCEAGTMPSQDRLAGFHTTATAQQHAMIQPYSSRAAALQGIRVRRMGV